MSATVYLVSDSFAEIKKVKELSLDASFVYGAVITDPPYPKHVQSNMCSGSLVGTKKVPKYELPFAALEIEQARALVSDLLRMTARWAAIFCSVESFGVFQLTAPDEYVRGGIWYKSNAMGQLTKDRPAAAYEGIALLHASDAKKRWNGKGSYGIWRCNGTRGKKDRHPNEKPIDLCLKLVALFSERGETVFDPFAGSAAIGEACVRLGRNYVGLDNDPRWVEKANERLASCGPPVTDEFALSLCSMRGDDPPEVTP